jgi:hypothetical protein
MMLFVSDLEGCSRGLGDRFIRKCFLFLFDFFGHKSNSLLELRKASLSSALKKRRPCKGQEGGFGLTLMKNKTTTRSVTYEQTSDHETDFMTVDFQATYGAKHADEHLSDEIESQGQQKKSSYKQQSRKG